MKKLPNPLQEKALIEAIKIASSVRISTQITSVDVFNAHDWQQLQEFVGEVFVSHEEYMKDLILRYSDDLEDLLNIQKALASTMVMVSEEIEKAIDLDSKTSDSINRLFNNHEFDRLMDDIKGDLQDKFQEYMENSIDDEIFQKAMKNRGTSPRKSR